MRRQDQAQSRPHPVSKAHHRTPLCAGWPYILPSQRARPRVTRSVPAPDLNTSIPASPNAVGFDIDARCGVNIIIENDGDILYRIVRVHSLNGEEANARPILGVQLASLNLNIATAVRIHFDSIFPARDVARCIDRDISHRWIGVNINTRATFPCNGICRRNLG